MEEIKVTERQAKAKATVVQELGLAAYTKVGSGVYAIATEDGAVKVAVSAIKGEYDLVAAGDAYVAEVAAKAAAKAVKDAERAAVAEAKAAAKAEKEALKAAKAE